MSVPALTEYRSDPRQLIAILVLVAILGPRLGKTEAAPPAARFVDVAADGKLVYDTDAQGNRIPDFSCAGYGGGGVPIPDVPARAMVAPENGDDTARIQAALDAVAALPLDERGCRGAVVLGRGRFEVAGRLRLRAGGVVLRGQGPGEDGTVLVATGTGRRTLIEVQGVADRRDLGPARAVTSAYVPVNARALELDSGAGLKAGDRVLVRRSSPTSWLERIGMAAVPGRPAPGWAAGKMDLVWERRVTAVDGNRVELDAPLTCALERELGGGSVTPFHWPGRIRQVGVENLRCESASDAANPADEEHAWMAVSVENAEDAWVRRVTAAHFVSSAVQVLESCRRVTVADCESLAPVSEVAGYRRHSFYTNGQQTLFLRCRAEAGRHDFAAGWLAAGPNAFVQCAARGALDFSGPVESWAAGVLYDNVTMDGGKLCLDNRELWDNGVGWAAANCVLWQCTAPVIIARAPPGARNWVIGCWAQFAGDASWRSPNEFVKPDSLYAAQLAERLGPGAAGMEEWKSGAVDEARVTAIPGGSSLFRQSRSRPSRSESRAPIPNTQYPLTLKAGWLTLPDRLLAGSQVDITWWRGTAQPGRAAESGPSVTRFVPGRTGPGLTDDLNALTGEMAEKGQAGLRHHWGLWYDRRRDDHEMVRRIDSDVWPPFFEQPWARSGKGQGWNGLSRYDLTKFNPWYFGRLREFAGLCDTKGLLLVDQMYFQHNILEAGAHWADFPWRPANCLQATGFPEPPPYAGNKRIFMAREFYDVSHPVRREIHRAYIRHCLDNLAECPNVLHMLGEEYSGPLSFMQFWLDTVAEWRRETGKRVLIGLSAPKDVQDAILADPVRSAQVDAIDLKYWWRAGDRTYAPAGGQDLAPRQHEREWKGGRPKDADLAGMAAEYRERYPGKAVLCDFDAAGWAFLCAGGSLPNLPRTTDPRLLAALTRMQPWKPGTGTSQWTLRDRGSSYLVHSAAGAEVTLDLTGETGTFGVREVNPVTGMVVEPGERVDGGQAAVLRKHGEGPTTWWLTR